MQVRIVLLTSLALATSGCQVEPPIPPVQIILYSSRIEPARTACSSGTVPVLQQADPVDEARCDQFGDVFLSRTSTGHPCSLSELEEELARTACREGATLARILRIQTPETSGSDCHMLRAALFECFDPEVAHQDEKPDA